jgi:hypothetical protein
VKVTGFGELCAVCYSPLDRAEAAAEDGDPIDDVKRELFTTECNHTYHRCCLVRCREADFTLCCLCKTGRIDGHGLTPEHVREKRAAQAVVDAQNAQRNAVIGAAARAREAVRRQYVRAMVNRPAQSRSQIVMPPVTEEGSPGAGAVSDGVPGGQPPGSPARSIAASSAPATPARGVPVMRGGYPSPASRGGNSPHLRRSRASSSNSTNNDDDFDEPVFTTAAEELRARARASAVAVAAAYSTASAPATPARHASLHQPPSTNVSLTAPNTEIRARAVENSFDESVDGEGRRAGDAGNIAAAREMERTQHAVRGIDLASVAAALGGIGGDDWGGNDDLSGASEGENTAVRLNDERGSVAGNDDDDDDVSFAYPFKSAARELAELGESSSAVMRALVVNGTASAPATPISRTAVFSADGAAFPLDAREASRRRRGGRRGGGRRAGRARDAAGAQAPRRRVKRASERVGGGVNTRTNDWNE